MGFLRRLFRAKKSNDNNHPNKRWSFLRSLNDSNKSLSYSRLTLPNGTTAPTSSLTGAELDANKHAIAVAAATAAVAEAALAAAQAAAEVVRLTSARGRGGATGGERGSNSSSVPPPRVGVTRARDEVLAAIKIQSAFRGYLARRALRALKALVKLQALVRGHIVRKQMADMLRRMQTLVRLQARARAGRASTSNSSHSSSMSAVSHHPRCGSNSNLRGSINNLDGTAISGPNWLDRWMEESIWNNRRDASHPPPRNRHDDERSAKILEVDTWKPNLKSRENRGAVSSLRQIWDSDYVNKSFPAVETPSKYSSRGPYPVPSMSSEEVLSLRSLNFPRGKDEANRSTESSPQVVSLSSRPGSSSAKRGPFTPTRSECCWGYFNGYPGHPNYMCNTESSRAKVRSQSAPRQRLDFVDRHGPSRRALQGSLDGGSNSELNYPVHYDFRSKTTAFNGLARNKSATSR